MSKAPETKFKERVLADLRGMPSTYCEKIQQLSKRGTLDIMGCMHGRALVLELKAGTGHKLDSLQAYKLERYREAGALALVSEPCSWEEDLAMIIRECRRGR